MFLARVKGTAPYFNRVVVVASDVGKKAVRDAMEADVVVRARFFEAAAIFGGDTC